MAESDMTSGIGKNKITLRGAIFIGIGSMVGAGIFALFGEAGTIAGAAVWVSFLIAGIIALLQGYSFAKLGARFPSSGGLIAWIVRGYGKGLFTGGLVVLGYFSVLIVTAMVAVSFGNYLTSLIFGEGAPQIWPKIFAVLIVCLLTFVNSIGAVFFDVTAIASIGSAVSLTIFAFLTVAHLRLAKDTGASKAVLVIALIATLAASLLFCWNTWLTAPQTFLILVVTIILAWVVEAVLEKY